MIGQLKLVICGNERRLTVNIMELRGLLHTSQHMSSVYFRVSLCPDAIERERFKSLVKEVKFGNVVFNESFTFCIPEKKCSRRLLISAWQQIEYRKNSRFIGCMSFSVRKLTSQYKTVHGWYQLLGEILGKRKHLAAVPMTGTNALRNMCNLDEKNSHYQIQCRHPTRPLTTIQINSKFKDLKIDSNSKNILNDSGNSLEGPSKVFTTGQEKENQALDLKLDTDQEKLWRRDRISPQSNRRKPIRRGKMSSSISKQAINTAVTPRKGIDRGLPRPTLVKPLRTKSARIISRHRDHLRKGLTNSIRVLYSDNVNYTASIICRQTPNDIQDDMRQNSSDSRHRLFCDDLLKENRSTTRLFENSTKHVSYLDIANKKENFVMPAIPTTTMYVEPDLTFDAEMFSHGLTLSRTGRVRAKKQHQRMAAYLETQRATHVKKETEQSDCDSKDEEISCWRKLSSAVDDERGYYSEPEIDDDIVEVYRVEKTLDEMPHVFSPLPTVLHSTGKNFSRLDYLDNFESVKTHIELLTLNESSRGLNAVDAQPKKRLRPSFLIALRRPLEEAFRKHSKSETTTDLERKFQYDVKLELSPLIPNDISNSKTNVFSQKSSFLAKTKNFFGSTSSLCTEKTYKIRRRKAILHKLRKLQHGSMSSAQSSTNSEKVCLLADQALTTPRKRLERSNSSVEEFRRCYLSGVDTRMPSMTLSRLSKSKKMHHDSGVYVQLTRNNGEGKTPEIYSLRKKSSESVLSGDQNITARRNNALGTLMTWLQKKSPDSRDSSPYRRTASVSGRQGSSRRARSFSRPDVDCKKERPSDSDETYAILRRNSFTASRRTSKKRSFRQSKRLLNDENVKPTEITLEEMMKNKVAVQAFRDFLKSEYSEENIDFWMDCECYRSMKTKSKQMKMAFKIFSQYLARSAPREVNIDFETRARTEERLKNPDKNTFIEPQSCIYSLMKCDSYRRFVASENYSKLHPSLSKDNNTFENRISALKMNFKNGPRKNKSPR